MYEINQTYCIHDYLNEVEAEKRKKEEILAEQERFKEFYNQGHKGIKAFSAYTKRLKLKAHQENKHTVQKLLERRKKESKANLIQSKSSIFSVSKNL